MSLAGLKKQFNKANQYMSEKIGGAEATKLTDDFVEMERKTDLTVELVDDLIVKTKEYLQPNPASRAKLMAVSKISKLSGQSKNAPYPQPEGTLGEAMIRYGRSLGEDGLFAQTLLETGESLKQMADIKYALEDNVKQNFLEPLHHLQTKDLKDVMHHRKKLQGRRLDYDCKKRKQMKGGMGAHITDDEIKMAEDKFDESLHLAQMGMHHLLENDVEQVTQLAALTEALLEYHKQCAEVLQTLTERLVDYKTEAANRPRTEFVPKKLHELGIHLHDEEDGDFNGAPPPYSSAYSASPSRSPYHSPARSPLHSPINPQAPLFPPSGFDTGFPGTDGRSPARSPVASPMNSNPPNLEPLFPPGGPSRSTNASPLPSPMRSPMGPPPSMTPHCKALYDFDPENEGELGFKEGDIILLTKRIDENWFEGTNKKNGQKGFFPVNYVEVIVNFP